MNKNFLIFSFGVFGLTALIFQVIFAKNLALLFGLTAPAIATALAVFFFGLALGSFVFGKISDKISNPKNFHLYIGLFVLTGIYGFFFPLLFKLLNFLILSVNQIYPLNFSSFNFFAFLFSFLFLIFPAILFGAGFPIISKIFIREENLLGKKISLLYFINTIGSVLGAALAGFWLIPSFGNNATIIFASILNIAIVGLLFTFFKPQIYMEKSINVNPRVDSSEPSSTTIRNPIFFYTLFITGFLALALEVLYTKTLILFIGSSTYAFSLILIIFLFGIALGSWAVSLFIDRIQKAIAYFGIFLGILGFWLFLTLKFFDQLPSWYLKIFKSLGSVEFSVVFSSQLLLTFLVIFPATFLMGMIFVLGIKLANPALEKLGEGIGKLYFSNTLGGVLGSLTAGFFLLPIFGFQKTLIFILMAYFLLAIFFIFKEKSLDLPIKAVLATFLVFWGVFAIVSRPWSPNILSSGVFIYAPEYLSISEEFGEQNLIKGIESDTLLFYKEGFSQVAVIERGPYLFLRVNGKTDASNSTHDLEHEILTGAIPLILHPDPKDVLMIGLGSGISLGTATQFNEPENIDAIEIDPAVIEAAQYFKADNNDALNDLRVKVISADARNYLYLTEKKYDIISSQPSNLWVSGNAYLFTKEYYELAKSRLKENGLMFQWVQIYNFQSEDIKSVLKTFSEVFPHFYLLNNINGTDLFLIGALKEETVLNFNEIEKKFQNEKIQNELSRINIYDPYEFLSYFVASAEETERFISDAKRHLDNKPFLEFSAPKSVFQDTSNAVLEIILKLREKTFSKLYFDLTQESPEIIKGLSSENKEKFKNYLIFRQKIIPVILALRTGDLDKALEFYKEVQETGVFNMILYKRLVNACRLKAEAVESQQGQEVGEKEWLKCEFLFNEIET